MARWRQQSNRCYRYHPREWSEREGAGRVRGAALSEYGADKSKREPVTGNGPERSRSLKSGVRFRRPTIVPAGPFPGDYLLLNCAMA